MKKTYLILCYLIATHFAFAQTTITLRPNSANGEDAWLDSGNPTTNYGVYPTAAAISWTRQSVPFDSRSLINFNLSAIPSNVIITSAKLSLYSNPTSDHTQLHSGLNSCYIQRVTSSWNENTVTWNTQPTSTTTNQVSLAASSSNTQDYIDIDVKNLINDIRNNPTTSFGLMLKLQTEAYYRSLIFASSDHTDSTKRPKLIITYSNAPIENNTLTLKPNSSNGKDSWLDSANPTTTHGTSPNYAAITWTRQSVPFDSRSLIDFNLSVLPANALINDARLSLYSNPTSDHTQLHSGSNSCFIQRITSSWDENLVTWNTQPTSTTTNQVSLAASTSATQDYLDIDVTNLINDIRNNPTAGYGLMLKLQTEATYRSLIFASSDHADSAKWPKLVISYSLVQINNNTISSSQNLCSGSIPSSLIGSTPTGGNGFFTYKWISSTTGANSGFNNAPGINSNKNYSVPLVNVTTWYKRIVTSLNGGAIDTSAAVSITINAKPKATIYSNKSASCQPKNTFLFRDSSTSSIPYTSKWNFGSGVNDTSSNSVFEKTYQTAGSYLVKLVVTGNNGCKDSTTKSVSLFEKPNASFSINKSTQCLKGNEFVFISQESINLAGLQYFWDLGNNETKNTSNFSYSYLEDGNYEVKLKLISINDCSDSSSSNVIIHKNPSANFTVNQSTQCLNTNRFIFSDSSKLGNETLTLSWNLGDNSASSNLSNIEHSYLAPNTFQVRLIAKSTNNCFDTITKSVVVNPVPKAKITANGDTSFCNGKSVTLVSDPGFTYKWLNGNTIIQNALAAQYIATTSGSYKTICTNNFNCSDTSRKITVTVNSLPVAGTITGNASPKLNDTLNYSISAQAGHTYNWFVTNGTIISGNNTNSINVKWNGAGSGNVKVNIKNANQCADSSSLNVSVTTSISEANKGFFQIFPNPANDFIKIANTNSSLKDATIIIYDALGKQVYSEKITANKYETEINLSGLNNGNYLMLINSNSGNESYKFLKN